MVTDYPSKNPKGFDLYKIRGEEKALVY